ncbi:PTS system mannose/fructose/sorbose family transporter subunit IID [Clostridium sp. 'White wine YQ']|uniref:PTS system mannose/fructose/sorbose family transporter subunit IID n=1 Tax=Clostridium sp. 'White wine YQ' TaxID=3027474 RepID=UPI0023659D3C|nr:PTS mannose transporter subunit IID [Clostridium sp. 'White wine YQ']MDD7795714.1 PTS mannose transporter subunit IID [Clostridium sp. 'White wine YQ']
MSEQKKLTRKDLVSVFIRSNFHQGSWNFERMQAIGYAYEMNPVLKKLYTTKEEQVEALKRHLEFFNTHPYVTSPILGVTCAMEEQRANGADIDNGAINGVKVGLMGPLAGVGDPIFWGTLRPVLAALGASIATGGSVLGPILFFVLWNVIRLGFRWTTQFYGYKVGANIVKDLAGNKLQKLTEGASILGLFIMGALVARWTSIKVPFVLSTVTNAQGKEVTTTIQSVLDSLLPGLLALGLTFLCMRLLRKKVSPITLIFGLFALGIIGYWLGILGL